MPVLIINEHGNWKKIRDVGGTEGWIHRSMLSNKKTFSEISENREKSHCKGCRISQTDIQWHNRKPSFS